MFRWLVSMFRSPAPAQEAPDPPPLAGLGGEAELLVAAYEGMVDGGVSPGAQLGMVLGAGNRAVAREIAATEAVLDAAERDRWILDVNDWATRAIRATVEGADPYRDDPQADAALRDVGLRVRKAVHADSMRDAAGALYEYVARERARTPPIT